MAELLFVYIPLGLLVFIVYASYCAWKQDRRK